MIHKQGWWQVLKKFQRKFLNSLLLLGLLIPLILISDDEWVLRFWVFQGYNNNNNNDNLVINTRCSQAQIIILKFVSMLFFDSLHARAYRKINRG
jgi:hypothetical protein